MPFLFVSSARFEVLSWLDTIMLGLFHRRGKEHFLKADTWK